MCRNIRMLFNFEPPATEREVRDASVQFVRKLSGMQAPSAANQAAFDDAVEEIARTASRLIAALVTNAVPKNREVEAAKAKARSALRFPEPAHRSAPTAPVRSNSSERAPTSAAGRRQRSTA